LVQLQKEIPLHPGAYLFGASPVGTTPANATGGPVWFPLTISHLFAATSTQIAQLQLFYNDTFGIVAGDTVGKQRLRLKMWLTT